MMAGQSFEENVIGGSRAQLAGSLGTYLAPGLAIDCDLIEFPSSQAGYAYNIVRKASNENVLVDNTRDSGEQCTGKKNPH